MSKQPASLLSEAQKATLKRSLGKLATRQRANGPLAALTGIQDFFDSDVMWEDFRRSLASNSADAIQETGREYGDFQTPLSLATAVCRQLLKLGYDPAVLVEPTCGRGNFIAAALDTFPNIQRVFALEIQEKYVAECKSTLLARLLNETRLKPEIHIVQGDVFDDARLVDFLKGDSRPILVLGNPPWVTNSTLSALNSFNLPDKSNFKAHKGLDALTGKSNFDIAEFILLQLIRTCAHSTATIAMLCKNIVIRNLVASTRTQGLGIKNIRAFEFDAAKEFGVACDASLFIADIAKERASRTCAVTELGKQTKPARVFGWVGDRFVADIATYRESQVIEGTCPIVWRQGIKHDCSKVMELDSEGDVLINGFGKPVHIERDRVFPLAKF